MNAELPLNAKRLSVVVLAAGKGTRMKSDSPKVLHPLLGKPMLQRVLETATETCNASSAAGHSAYSLDRITVILGHQADMVTEALSKWNHLPPLQTVIQQPQLGTGHALMQVKQQQAFPPKTTLLILSGDVPLLQPKTLQHLLNTHQTQGNHLTVLATHLANPTGYGRLVLDTHPENGPLQAIVEEKDASAEQKQITLINGGVYVLDWDTMAPFLEQLSPQNAQGEYYLTDLVLLGNQAQLKIGHAEVADPQEIEGVNDRKQLAQLARALNQRTLTHWMAEGVSIIDPTQTWISPEVSISRDTVIHPGTTLEGKITIGRHCSIGPHSTLQGTVQVGDHSQVVYALVTDSTIGEHSLIGPFTHLRNEAVIGNYVKVGNFVEVKNSQIAQRTNVSHLAYIGDAELGEDVNIGAGTITANFDPLTEVKSRTILKDGVKIGSNTVLVAPVTVGENASVAAGSVITHDVSPNALAIARQRQSELADWVTKKKEQLKLIPR